MENEIDDLTKEIKEDEKREIEIKKEIQDKKLLEEKKRQLKKQKKKLRGLDRQLNPRWYKKIIGLK